MSICQRKGINVYEQYYKEQIDSGWKEQRRINTDMIRKKYYEIGLDYPEVVDKFLKEYGMLNINPNDKCYYDVSFDAIWMVHILRSAQLNMI